MIEQKLSVVRDLIRAYKSCLIAVSGGVDSSLLLAIAAENSESVVHAATVKSIAHPPWELERAVRLAAQFGVPHHIIPIDELADPLIRENGPRRCYYCKRERYIRILKLRKDLDLHVVCDGSNADDRFEVRPGLAAIQELAIRTPLAEAGFTKADIRALARRMRLEMWDSPATACLFTRIPTGEPLEESRIRRILSAERILLDAEFPDVRIRDHGSVARIELPPVEILRFFQSPARHDIIAGLKAIGYRFVSVDAEGYRRSGPS